MMDTTGKVICNSWFKRRHLYCFMGISLLYTSSVYFLAGIRMNQETGGKDDPHKDNYDVIGRYRITGGTGAPATTELPVATSLPPAQKAAKGSLAAKGPSVGNSGSPSATKSYVQSISTTEPSPVPSETSTPQTTPKSLPLSQDISINPPTLNLDLWSEILKAEEVDLTLLSNLIQNQIRDVQSNCSGVSLKCGHDNIECGFGCQVHQRVACLMISYSLNVPLIHDETTGWIFTHRWSDLFLPLGSNCSEGPQTVHWMWNKKKNTYENPLHNGIPVTKELADFLNKNLEAPFPWLVGQFIKYSVKLTAEIERDIKRDMVAINFERPIIGIHVRRTDKAKDAGLYTHHEIPEYMTWAEEAYKKVLNVRALSPKRTVFIASDDAATVVPEATKYANWKVLGFPSQPTLGSPSTRKGAAYHILRDMFILSECDHVVCGFSSNICTMVLEMLSFKHADGYNLVKSLDGKYTYSLHRNSMASQVVGISGKHTLIWKRKTK